MRAVSRVSTMIFLASLLAACALTEDIVPVPYTPSTAGNVPGATSLGLTVADGRTADRSRISTKTNGYGVEMGAIRSTREVPEIVHEALTKEFEQRGFRLEQSQRNVSVSIERFYNSFTNNFLSGSATGDVQLRIAVTDSTGAAIFNHLYAGKSEMSVMMYGGSNAAESVAAALQNAIVQMFADPDFLMALGVSSAAKPIS